MTDRELLELAAKAVGYEYRYARERHWIRCPNGYQPWNPLTDDGDALRLAVKLELDLAFNSPICAAWKRNTLNSQREDVSIDPYAATRRAIVRAAAEIGKEMK